MIDVNHRIAQWDQQRIMSSVEPASHRTQIISSRPSRPMPAAATGAEDEGPRPSAAAAPARASSAAAGTEPGKPAGTPTGDGATLTVADQGQSRRLPHRFSCCSGCCFVSVVPIFGGKLDVDGSHSQWFGMQKVKVKERIWVLPSHSFGMSIAIWDHTVLPATRHK